MKTLTVMAVTIGAAFLVWVGWGAYIIVTTERPRYEVVQHLSDGVEIRQYEEQTWISANGDSDNSAFRVLASYIFGDNKDQAPVAMTAPVITDTRMSFILPKDVTMDVAPEPNGQPIAFSQVPARKLATLTFSWTTSHSRVEEKTQRLLSVLGQKGIKVTGEPILMRYNDPATPPFMRRNEVAIEVDKVPTS